MFGEFDTMSNSLTGLSAPKHVVTYLVKIDFSTANPEHWLAKELTLEHELTPDHSRRDTIKYTPAQWALRLSDPAVEFFLNRNPGDDKSVDG